MPKRTELTVRGNVDDGDTPEIAKTGISDPGAAASEAVSRMESGALEDLIGGVPTGNGRILRDPRGNLYESVPFRRAQLYLDCGLRQIQKLVKDGVLDHVGTGHKKRIKVSSLLKYLPESK